MHAALLLCVVALGQSPEDKLLSKLDASVQKLLEKEPQAQEVRKAAELLRTTNSSDRWTNYAGAVKILRQTRPKAGIPLLLAYMVRHSDSGSSHISVAEYAQTLTILTGKDIPNPYQYIADRKTPVRVAVEKLVADWWEPEQDKIDTDIGKWSDEQLQVLASCLLAREARSSRGGSSDPESGRDGPTSYGIYHLLYYNTLHAGSDRSDWFAEELHPKMLPTFLAGAGYRASPDAPPQRDTSRPAYAAVPLLAALRKNGEAEDLDELAEDSKQAAGVRLTCVMALYRAGEKLKTKPLLAIAAGDKHLERRLVAILTLREAGQDREVGRALVKLLDEGNFEVRTAAICALRGALPPDAVPKLKEAIDSLDPPQAMLFIFDVLGEYKTREANEALAGFLGAALEDRQKAKHLSYALRALESATGQRWSDAGRTEEQLRAKARLAVEWWKTQGRQKSE
jgi:hypothetical protein